MVHHFENIFGNDVNFELQHSNIRLFEYSVSISELMELLIGLLSLKLLKFYLLIVCKSGGPKSLCGVRGITILKSGPVSRCLVESYYIIIPWQTEIEIVCIN